LARADGGVWGEDFDSDGTIVLRSTEQTIDGEWAIEDPARRKLTKKEIKGSLLKEGDLVLTKSSGSHQHIGKTSLVDKQIAALNACFSNFMLRIRLREEMQPMFMWFVLNNRVA